MQASEALPGITGVETRANLKGGEHEELFETTSKAFRRQ